jgi:hypothetical protein
VIFVDTNLISENVRPQPDPKVAAWIRENDAQLALSTIVLAEIKFGIERIRPDERAKALEGYFEETRRRFAGRTYAFDEPSAVIYGQIMGEASRRGHRLSVPDGMIAAVALRHDSPLATRNRKHFAINGLKLVDPWA